MSVQTDIFSLFGMDDDVNKEVLTPTQKAEKKKAEAKKKAPAKKDSSSVTVKKEDPFEVNTETIIRYGGNTIPLSMYFTHEEIEKGLLTIDTEGKQKQEKLVAEDVRRRMELTEVVIDGISMTFPELDKDYTKILYIKEKNMIIPTVTAGKKGNFINEYKYCMGGVLRKTEAHSSSLPKISWQLLSDFISIAKYYADKHGTEVHGDVFWNQSEKYYVLDIPQQTVSSTIVIPGTTNNPMLYAETKKVMEIHSHHYMKPTPSSRDNKSERRENMLYAIVGDLNMFFPQVSLRTFYKGKHIPLNPFLFIEYPFNSCQMDIEHVEVM